MSLLLIWIYIGIAIQLVMLLSPTYLTSFIFQINQMFDDLDIENTKNLFAFAATIIFTIRVLIWPVMLGTIL